MHYTGTGKMPTGEEKVIYRGNKKPTADTRLPEAPEKTRGRAAKGATMSPEANKNRLKKIFLKVGEQGAPEKKTSAPRRKFFGRK